MGQLDNQTAVITGGGSGIGFTLAERFHREGAQIVICGRREEVLIEAAEKISPGKERIRCIKADISEEQDIMRLMQAAVDWTNKIDILINNAAAMRINKPPQETSFEEWKGVIDTNITGAFLCCREAGKVMIAQKRGKIINISSISGGIVNKYFHGGSYEVSKCALNMLTKVLAVEWAPYNITVNAVAPGYYDTQPNRDFFGKETGLYQKVLEMIPAGKLGDLEELSRLILHLVTDPRNYLTGATITIDGGYTLW